MTDDTNSGPDLERAYALRTPADSVALYADWADSYDRSFAQDSGYVLHDEVARQQAAQQGGRQPAAQQGGVGLATVPGPPRGVSTGRPAN